MKTKMQIVMLALLITSGAAMAQSDECKDMATKIANSENLVVQPKGTLFGLGAAEGRFGHGDYGAYLNCRGTYGMNLHARSPDNAPQGWYEFAARIGFILTDVDPTIIRDGIKQCVKLAAASGNHYYANLMLEGARVFCDIDNDNSVSLYVAK